MKEDVNYCVSLQAARWNSSSEEAVWWITQERAAGADLGHVKEVAQRRHLLGDYAIRCSYYAQCGDGIATPSQHRPNTGFQLSGQCCHPLLLESHHREDRSGLESHGELEKDHPERKICADGSGLNGFVRCSRVAASRTS